MPAQEHSDYHRHQDGSMNLSVHAIKQRLDAGEPLILLDIREPYELILSRLDHQLHIPMSQMSERWREIPRDRPIVVFCHHGVRSVNLLNQLQAAGFTNLINMEGGIDAWAKEIDPAVPLY